LPSRTSKKINRHDCLNNRRGRRNILLPLYSRRVFILLIAIIIQMSCASPTQIIRETSSSGKPKWIETPPRENETLYFVGIKTSAETLEEGRNAALKDAMSKISDFMGCKIESLFKDYISEIEQKQMQQIKSTSSSTVKFAQVVDSYYEKMARIEKNFKIEKYDVYVLVKFSKAEVQAEINRQQRVKDERIRNAFEYYLNGLEKEQQHKYYDARMYFQQALTLVEGVEDILIIDKNGIKNSEELHMRLQDHLKEINLYLSRVKLSIHIVGSDQANQAFNSSFVSELNKHGLTVTDKLSAMNITGNVNATESSYLMGNYCFYAEGSVSAQKTSNNQIVATYAFKVKGFHRLKEQATLNAFAEAGIEAGNALSEMILKKETTSESTK